jgi:signal transduction histidine kinase
VIGLELPQLASAWPLGASLAAAVAVRGMRVGRRRTALNEALHELRRPLQVLALTVPAAELPAPAAFQGSVQMAATALERLDREINGEPVALARVPISLRLLLDSAIGRWRARAEMAGGSLALRWRASGAVLHGDRCELARALDNLIANAIEHGGPEVVVEAVAEAGRLRLGVIDSGHGPSAGSRRQGPAALIARATGRRRRGHGLRVVRRAAAGHGGEFQLRGSERGTEALLELPLAGEYGSDGG